MNHRDEFPIKVMCRVLRVSRAGYYDWLNREESPRTAENRELSREIRRVFERSDSTYGSPRIVQQLAKEGDQCAKNRAARLMKKEVLRSVHRDKFKVITTDSRQSE